MPFNVGDIVLITHTGGTGRISNITRSAGRTAYHLVRNRQTIYNTDPDSIFYNGIYFLEEELELTGKGGGKKRNSNKKRKSYKKRKSNNKRKYNKKKKI